MVGDGNRPYHHDTDGMGTLIGGCHTNIVNTEHALRARVIYAARTLEVRRIGSAVLCCAVLCVNGQCSLIICLYATTALFATALFPTALFATALFPMALLAIALCPHFFIGPAGIGSKRGLDHLLQSPQRQFAHQKGFHRLHCRHR